MMVGYDGIGTLHQVFVIHHLWIALYIFNSDTWIPQCHCHMKETIIKPLMQNGKCRWGLESMKW